VGTYIVKRVLLIIPTLWLVTLITFLLVRLIPGDVVDVMYAEMIGMSTSGGVSSTTGTIIDREDVLRVLGLDVPMHIQYMRWMGFFPTPDPETGESRYEGILQGDFGDSIWQQATVYETFVQRLPVSIELGILAIVIGLIIAIPVGIFSAIRQDTMTDYVGRAVAITGLAVPNFWIATMVMVYPAIWWNWSPSMQYIKLGDDLMGNLGMMWIPALIMGTSMSAGTMRFTRTMMLEVLRQDYIRTAWSKGLKERVIVARHALRNALIPVITIIGMQVPLLIGGTVIMEQIFNLPGVGRYLLGAIGRRDYPVVSGTNLMIAAFVLLNNVVIDLAYAYLDPRVKYQ